MEGPRKGTEEGCRLEKGRVRGEGSSSGRVLCPPAPFICLTASLLFHMLPLSVFVGLPLPYCIARPFHILCCHLYLSDVNELVLSCHCIA